MGLVLLDTCLLICVLCFSMCVYVVLEKLCNELMMAKFGKLVNLEALQMLSGSRRLEELKQEKLLKEAEYTKEIKQWDVR